MIEDGTITSLSAGHREAILLVQEHYLIQSKGNELKSPISPPQSKTASPVAPVEVVVIVVEVIVVLAEVAE